MNAKRILLATIVILVATTGLLVSVLVWIKRASHQNTVAPSASVSEGPIDGVDPAAPAIQLVGSGSKACWSPDGREIMFGVQGSGLQVLDLQTRTTRALEFRGKDPVWSPAGSVLACVRAGSYGTTNTYLSEEVWLVPMKDGLERRVTRGGFPSWSVDGRSLYVHSRVNNQILSVNTADLDASPAVFYEKTPSWYYSVAPDGRQVAFGSRNQLEIRDRVTGAVIRQWPTPGHRGLLPAWSPDGALVAFGGFNGTRLGVWIFQVATGRAVPVQEGLFTMPAWSPGGHWLAFDQRVGRSNSVWLVGRPHLDQLLR